MEVRRWSKDGNALPKDNKMALLPTEDPLENKSPASKSRATRRELQELLVRAGEVLQRKDNDERVAGISVYGILEGVALVIYMIKHIRVC